MKKYLYLAVAATALVIAGCDKTQKPDTSDQGTGAQAQIEHEVVASAPTVQDAKEFLENSETEIVELTLRAKIAYWVNANFITYDTKAMATKVGEEGALLSTRLANEAKRFNDLDLPADMARKLDGLKRGSNFPAPDKPGAALELSGIMTELDATYSEGKFTYNGKAMSLGALSNIIATSRDPKELQTVWEG